MRRSSEIRVGDWPSRPLIIFDGECDFCRQWVGRWKGMTGDRVDYRSFQEVAGRFPEVSEGEFRARVWLIEPDGRAVGGARAVSRLYALAGGRPGPAWIYHHVPGCAGAAEAAYDAVARHRGAAMLAVRWLWGSIDRRPTYRRTRAIFLRGLGLAYLAAFGSLTVQVDGLIGSQGIAPAAEYLDRAADVLGGRGSWRLPTLLWLDASDRALHVLCWGGVVAAGVLMAGIFPGFCLVWLWLAYLSLVVVGQPFLGYQWDALLLEAGFLGFLLAPWGLRLDRARREPSGLALGLVRWLLFRLMFLSGVVKLASGDPAWAGWQAMKYHYETQPLPTWTSWYMHQLPAWFQSTSVAAMFWAELVAPFLIFGPRRVRMLGFWSLLFLQVLIAGTGNYGFFNLLGAVLCLVLVEDRDWGRPIDNCVREGRRPGWLRVPLIGAAAVIVTVTTLEALDRCGLEFRFPGPMEAVRRRVAPFRSLNAYGLFAVMTTERPEIVVEGSDDGARWTPYAFRWKPGDPGAAPRFATPHLPRLDWQMWFAALGGDCRGEPWFLAFERRLLEGSPRVLRLLGPNPFPARPPRYVRARLYEYRFTGRDERAWWRREEVGPYCPPVSLGAPRGAGRGASEGP